MLEDFRLKVFLTVARTGSFTKAANELGVSQPAVSQNINTLEKIIGAPLFERRRGEIFLTADGIGFREYAERILYWYDAAEAMFGSAGRATANAPIRIAADPVLADYLLPQALGLIHSARPELGFDIRPLPATEFDADMELSIRPSPETMDFEGESKLIGVMDAVVVASPMNRSLASAAGEDGQKPFSTIAGVHVSNSFAVWDRYQEFLTPDITARVAVSSNSTEAIKTMLRGSTDLAGILPAFAVRRELAEGTLLRMPVSLPEFSFDIHCSPLPDFAGKTVYQLIRKTLKDCVYGR